LNRLSYTLLLYLLAPVVWIYFICRGIKDSDYWKNWPERVGYVPEKIGKSRTKNSQCLHVHCASVGESKAAFPLIKCLVQKYPEALILVTTSTPTGRSVVNKLVTELEVKSNIVKIDVCYLPIDWPGACRRFLDRINPSISILMETELWPNLIHQIGHRNTPILLANARMSDASLEKYFKYSKLSLPMFASLTHIAAQFDSDKTNFLTLGCDNERISIVGSVKFDIDISIQLKQKQQELRNLWCANRPCWIAASIHPAEFSIILDTHKKLLKTIPDLLLIAVPRHSERFHELKNTCKKRNIHFVSRTENKPPTESQSIVIGDTMGEMMLLFGAADIAFVGGSLMDRGGHNPIEPATCGLPVVMGFSVYNFSGVCGLMEESGALTLVDNAQQLGTTLERMLLDKDDLSAKQQIAIKTITNNQGSVNKQISLIDKIVSMP